MNIRRLARVAAEEVASFTYEDWFNYSGGRRGERVEKAVLRGRVLTRVERDAWRVQRGTDAEDEEQVRARCRSILRKRKVK